MLIEAQKTHLYLPDYVTLQEEVDPHEVVNKLAVKAERKPGGPHARQLAALAIEAAEEMHAEVFGDKAQPFADEIALAKEWSQGGRNIDTERLYDHWLTLQRQVFSLSSSLSHQETETDPIYDPRVQASLVTGNILLSVLYLEPEYRGIHPTKPPWHARLGARSLSGIITSDAANVMAMQDGSQNHQAKIDKVVKARTALF